MEALKPRESEPVPAQKKYSGVLRERAVPMMFEMGERTGQRKGALDRIGEQLCINPDAVQLG